MKPPDEAIDCWHFIGADKKLKYKDGRKVIKGRTLSILNKNPIKLCKNGMHGSKKIFDALSWSNQSYYLCKVKIWGDVEKDDSKLAGRHRHCEYMVKWERVYKLALIDELKSKSKGKYKSTFANLYKYMDKKISKKMMAELERLKINIIFERKLINLIDYIMDYNWYDGKRPMPEKYILARIESEINR